MSLPLDMRPARRVGPAGWAARGVALLLMASLFTACGAPAVTPTETTDTPAPTATLTPMPTDTPASTDTPTPEPTLTVTEDYAKIATAWAEAADATPFPDNSWKREAQDIGGKNTVVLYWHQQEFNSQGEVIKSEQFPFCSGFFVQNSEGDWFLVTALHCLVENPFDPQGSPLIFRGVGVRGDGVMVQQALCYQFQHVEETGEFQLYCLASPTDGELEGPGYSGNVLGDNKTDLAVIPFIPNVTPDTSGLTLSEFSYDQDTITVGYPIKPEKVNGEWIIHYNYGDLFVSSSVLTFLTDLSLVGALPTADSGPEMSGAPVLGMNQQGEIVVGGVVLGSRVIIDKSRRQEFVEVALITSDIMELFTSD